MEKLTQYLKARKVTQAQFGARIGLTQAAVSMMCRGKMRPSLEMAFRIQKVTGGKVPAASWINTGE